MQKGAPKYYHITLSVGRIKDISVVVLLCCSQVLLQSFQFINEAKAARYSLSTAP